MFDIAYKAEATIEFAKKEYKEIWDEIPEKIEIGNREQLRKMFYCKYLENVIKYWSIMYETHGV